MSNKLCAVFVIMFDAHVQIENFLLQMLNSLKIVQSIFTTNITSLLFTSTVITTTGSNVSLTVGKI